MTVRRSFIGFTLLLFTCIFGLALFKNSRTSKTGDVIEAKVEVIKPKREEKKIEDIQITLKKEATLATSDVSDNKERKKVEQIRRLFSKGNDKFPIVETVTYTSRTPWLKGRPAWIADYASYYQTSRHFIARSLNGKPDYYTQNVAPGQKFNVFKEGKRFQFYLLVDLKTCTMDFYYLDLEKDERVFLKTYDIGVGRLDSCSPSGSLTPIGKYTLGEKVAIYKPGIEHYFQNKKTQMIEVFGTRWLPFDQELENCTDSAKGYGIHGVPCRYDAAQNLLIEEEHGKTGYVSDGCLRLQKDDIEELFAIVITKPTIVEIVKDKREVSLPMSRENLSGD